MNLALRNLVAIPLAGLLVAPASAAAGRIVGTWPASGIASQSAQVVQLSSGNGQALATVNRARVARLMDVLSRIEAAAGVAAQLFVAQTVDRQPNAFAAAGRDSRHAVFVTPAMLELLGDDDDAAAALVGHELAHLARQHGAERASRQGLMQGLGLVATLLAGARGNARASRLVDFGGILVHRSFSREEERDADRLGIGYAAAAGFDPQGALRLFERMASAGRATPLAFLSTHPGGEERLANARQVIASLPSALHPGAAPGTLQGNDAAAIAWAMQQERHDAEIGARLAAEALRVLQSDASAGHPVAWPALERDDADQHSRPAR